MKTYDDDDYPLEVAKAIVLRHRQDSVFRAGRVFDNAPVFYRVNYAPGNPRRPDQPARALFNGIESVWVEQERGGVRPITSRPQQGTEPSILTLAYEMYREIDYKPDERIGLVCIDGTVYVFERDAMDLYRALINDLTMFISRSHMMRSAFEGLSDELCNPDQL